MFDLPFYNDRWRQWTGLLGLVMTGLVLPLIDRSEAWVLGLWFGLFIVQAGQIAY